MIAAGELPTDRRSAFRFSLPIALLVAAVMVASAVAVSIELPFGEWDAMAFGSWAREIGTHWPHIRFANQSAIEYHRPLFYFLEGTVWAVFGFHQALGRLVALAFGIVLGGALSFAAWRSVPRRYAPTAAAIAMALLGASTPFERFVVSGLSDVPVAAMLAATGALVLVSRSRPAAVPLVAVAACLSLLTKPTALASLLGLAAAVAIGSRAALLRRARVAGAILAGTAVALVYDGVQAHLSHVSLRTFLTTGSDGFYASLAARKRDRALLDESWLGAELRLVLLFAIAYALARLVVSHAAAIRLALPAAIVWSIAGPRIAGGAHGLVAGSGSNVDSVAVLVLAAALLFAFASPDDAVPGRLELARLLVWAAPPLIVWVVYSAYDDRLLSAAWPPLLLLASRTLLPVFAGAAAIDGAALAVPGAALLILFAYGTVQLNGLGRDGWHRFSDGFGNVSAMRDLALGGDFSAELEALEPQLTAREAILTTDSRLRFYYGERVQGYTPLHCSQLQGPATLLVVLESDEDRAVYGDRASASFWERCRSPTPTLVAERPGAFAILTTGRPVDVAGGCGAAPTTGLAIEFGRFRTAHAATPLLAEAKGAGFVLAKVERFDCNSYRVVETGVPSRAVGRSIVTEARSAHLRARIVETPAS